MSEEQIAAAAAPIVEAAVKALTPEAEAVLNELHGVVFGEVRKLDEELPGLVKLAETDGYRALCAVENHLMTVANAIRAKLHYPAVAGRLDPTPAVPTPQA